MQCREEEKAQGKYCFNCKAWRKYSPEECEEFKKQSEIQAAVEAIEDAADDPLGVEAALAESAMITAELEGEGMIPDGLPEEDFEVPEGEGDEIIPDSPGMEIPEVPEAEVIPFPTDETKKPEEPQG
jgi:nitrogen regulatory protein PII-like uncharacterized protein